MLPFKITHDRAAELFRQWVGGLWFAPGALAQCARTSAIRGAYVPAWTYEVLSILATAIIFAVIVSSMNH